MKKTTEVWLILLNKSRWFTYHKDEGEGDYYTADIIKIDFDNWIKAGMKID